MLGTSWREAKRDLHKIRWAYPAVHGRYDPRALDLLRAMRGQPHRALETVHKDWLARYLEETRDSTEHPRPAPNPGADR